ncbi:protein kinase [Mycobacterium triplex]|uniref:non-specific serine/threonine protein kinase n=1 Tax=Mycobacterium triplex TaxID=47839 RepID=A0A024K344_9MYCO|nr:serine/threonine-protein kinase [Mycobacterium triplex]ORW98620.1 protein kinase [Mycobacterium triplex]CDO90007.1 Ser/Thr protein kinase [Mycobacterium triplex]
MSEEQNSRVGTMFGPYHLKRLLGRGGMGEVYEAEHTVKEWTVAVKVMTAEFSRDPVFRERMRREARTAGRLQEPHVVPIHDYGEIDGQMFMEMHLIEGIDLDDMLKRFGPLTAPRAVAVITQIASALDAAHAAGVMHRDIKPPNILITRDDFAYLVDFGIASATTDEKLTQLGTAVGTWKYMAPERFSNGEVTYRADIYALACVLYECLTGTPPYRAGTAGELVRAHTSDAIPAASAVRSGIPKAFDAVIARGMAKKPEDRYASAGDLALAAHEALSNPDQDHADDILRRSQEATQAAETPAPAAPQPPLNPPPAPYPPPSSGPVPPTARPWAPESGPVPTPSQPVPGPQYYQGTSGNWGAPPPAGPTGWALGQQPPPKPKRNPWPIVIGAVALVGVLVLGAIGVYVATKDDDNPQPHPTATSTTTPPRTTTSTTTTTTTVTGDLEGQLLTLIPPGYPSGVCAPATPKPNTVWSDALAVLDCDQNTNPGGPSKARYGLFANPSVLKDATDADIKLLTLATCPGETNNPQTWQHPNAPKVDVGVVACGTYDNHPNMVWSNTVKLLLCDVFGDPPTIDELHTWWTKYGG